jgi:DNA-binding IclR family transcriptional regulator
LPNCRNVVRTEQLATDHRSAVSRLGKVRHLSTWTGEAPGATKPPEREWKFDMSDERQRDPVSRTLKAYAWIICEAGPSFGVREMAGALNISPSAAHRALTALARNDLVRQDDETGRYVPSVEMFRLAQVTLSRFPLRQISLPHLHSLVDACDETVLLGIYDPDRVQMMFAAAAESKSPLRYVVRLNEWVPLHLGASGLGILSFLPTELRDLVITRNEQADATGSFDANALRARIEQVRKDGYAVSVGQRVAGAVGFAAPIFFPAGQVVGDVCITLPEQRFSEDRRNEFARLVVQCAASISEQLMNRSH